MSKELATQTELDRKVDLLLSLSTTTKNDVKKALDRNFLKILVDANPDMDKKYFLDFIHKAQLTGADPRLNQIYLIPHKTKNYDTQEFEIKGTVMFNYMFYMQLAQQTGQLEDWGYEVVEDSYLDIISGRKKPSWKATAWVKRKGREKVAYECDFWEIAKLDFKTGLPTATWKAAPKFMMRKCAIAGAFRWAFPETMGNFYISEEMDKVIDIEISQPSTLVKKEAIAQKVSTQAKLAETVQKIDSEQNFEHEPEFSTEQQSMDSLNAVNELNEIDLVRELDIEDMRGELMDTLETMDNAFFEGMKKTKAEILVQISLEKKLEHMKKMYDFIIEKMNQNRQQ
jgi:phage recombination protein Bet